MASNRSIDIKHVKSFFNTDLDYDNLNQSYWTFAEGVWMCRTEKRILPVW